MKLIAWKRGLFRVWVVLFGAWAIWYPLCADHNLSGLFYGTLAEQGHCASSLDHTSLGKPCTIDPGTTFYEWVGEKPLLYWSKLVGLGLAFYLAVSLVIAIGMLVLWYVGRWMVRGFRQPTEQKEAH